MEAARSDSQLHRAAQGGGRADRASLSGDGRKRRGRGGRCGGLRRGGRVRANSRSAQGCLHPAGNVMKISYREAVRQALHEALTNDPRVFLMGEDVGRYGGSYAVSKGFFDEFGPERIRDTPLSELGFVGAGVGAALGGMRPIVEVMTVNFSLLSLDAIVNTAATLRHMSGGQFSVPLVLRMATGAGRQLAAGSWQLAAGSWQLAAGSPAFAQPGELVRPHSRHPRAGASDRGRRARHAGPGAGRPGPGSDVRACAALQPGSRAAR